MTRPIFRTKVLTGLAAAALLVTGCASSTDSEKPSAKPIDKSELVSAIINAPEAGTPVEGGTLRIAEYAEARSLDPTKTYSNGAAGGSALIAVYDALMRYDFESSKFVPQMAESLTTDDNTTWTLKLRPDAQFSDKTPVNADAVLNSIAFYTKSYGYGALQWLSNVQEAKKVDDHTVEFTTRLPWATFPNMLSHGPGIIMAPAAYADPANFTPIGAGPFVFKSYSPAESLELVRNDNYWGDKPHLDGLKFVWPQADTTKVESMRSGDVDTAYLRDRKAVTAELAAKTAGMRWVVGQGSSIWINVREGRDTAIPEVREALHLVWDPKAYLKRIGDDESLGTESLVAETSPWYTEPEIPANDVEKAKGLIAEAKKKGFDGTLDLIHFGDANSKNNALTTQALLQASGVEINLVPMTSIADQTKRVLMDHDYDLAFSAVTIADEDPYLRLAGQFDPKSPTNASGYSNPEMSKLVAELAGKAGPAEGKDVMAKIQALWQTDPAALGVATGVYLQPWNDNVHGIKPTTETLMMYDKAWLSK